MINYSTITRYLSYKFIRYLFLICFVIIIILFVSNAFDTLQKFRTIYLSPKDFWLLILLKIPFLFNEISSIIGFISTALFLRYLSSSNELIIIISNGIPIWRVFIIPMTISFLFGIILVMLIGPLGTVGVIEYEKMEAKLSGTPPHNFLISKTGIFFYEHYENTNRVVQAKNINTAKKTISDITILIVDRKNKFLQRIDSPIAILDDNRFELQNPVISKMQETTLEKKLYLPTNLTINHLIQRSMPPEMISIWSLPSSIQEIDALGLPILNHLLYFYKQFFKPLAMAAMVLTACLFVTLNNRDNSAFKNGILTLITGVGAYFLLELALHILAYGGLPPLFAAMLPIIFIILMSNFAILHFHEA